MEQYIAIIPCRANSKGLENKNLRLVDDEPLWRRAIGQAVRLCDEVLLSTDISKCQLLGIPEGVMFDNRPTRLCSDKTKMEEVIRYLITSYDLEEKTLMLLQPTSPLRRDADINHAINLYECGRFDMVMSVVETDSKILKYGFLQESKFLPVNDSTYCFENRQNLPKVYAPNGAIYIFTGETFMSSSGFPNNNIGASLMEQTFSIDIDSQQDLDFVNHYLNSVTI